MRMMLLLCILDYNSHMPVKYMTPEQVADRLQVHRETVYRYLRSRKLAGIHISRRMWRVSEIDLEAFIRQDWTR